MYNLLTLHALMSAPTRSSLKDPIHSTHSAATNKAAAVEMPDFAKIGDEIFGVLKKSPIGKLFSRN